jgi:hypothetical protein
MCILKYPAHLHTTRTLPPTLQPSQALCPVSNLPCCWPWSLSHSLPERYNDWK